MVFIDLEKAYDTIPSDLILYCSATSRCALVPFEWYGHPKNVPKKIHVTLSPYIFHVKTK